MASITMTASFFGGATSTVTRDPSSTTRRSLIVAKASRASAGEKGNLECKTSKEESSSGRRNLVLVAAAAAACSISKVTMAEEPKPGTPEAKKKYAPVCVTMPTARICHK